MRKEAQLIQILEIVVFDRYLVLTFHNFINQVVYDMAMELKCFQKILFTTQRLIIITFPISITILTA